MGLSNFVAIGPPNERQGAYVHTRVSVWHCGDDHCDCAQVVAERMYEHALVRGLYWPVRIWEGKYFTEGEGKEKRLAELGQAHHDIRLRFPDDKPGDSMYANEPWRYPVDHSDDSELRRLAAADRERAPGRS